MSGLGVSLPVVAAPMAGGPSTPALVVAAAEAGSLGFLAAGYLTVDALASRIADVRACTTRFGVNVFVPTPVPADRVAFQAYRASLAGDAARLGVSLPAEPVSDDDGWDAKIDLLIGDPVPVVGFTFGVPDAPVVTRFQRAGSLVVQTVTSPAEAAFAVAAGVDALIVQAAAAGGHFGTFTPASVPAVMPLPELVAAVRAVVRVPVLAAGGVSSASDVAAALGAGASAVLVGTALLRADEAGTSEVHRAALHDPRFTMTTVTRAFTGRPARALHNAFVARHDADAPLGYPAVHHLTSALRKASAAAGDADGVHLWAGTGWRAATDESAAAILRRLAG